MINVQIPLEVGMSLEDKAWNQTTSYFIAVENQEGKLAGDSV